MLGGNQWMEDAERLKWRPESNEVPRDSSDRLKTPLIVNDFTVNVLLHAKEIRTFIVTVSRS